LIPIETNAMEDNNVEEAKMSSDDALDSLDNVDVDVDNSPRRQFLDDDDELITEPIMDASFLDDEINTVNDEFSSWKLTLHNNHIQR